MSTVSIFIISSNWQYDCKSASFAWFALDRYFAFMGIDDKFNNAKAQSATFSFSRQGVINLVEAVENFTNMPVSKTYAVIRNRKADIILFSEDLQRDLLLVAGVFAGVVQKIDNDSNHRVVVGGHFRQIVRDINRELTIMSTQILS